MTTAGPIDPDALTLDAVRGGALRDRAVTVLGFARSGIALARFVHDAGARVTVYDGRPADELAEAVAALEGRDVRVLAGPSVDPTTAWAGADLVTTSPSINPDYPTTEPRLRAALQALVAARAAGDPTAPALVSEPDLFLRLCPAPTIGVTGTKGKTTTASLIAAVLTADSGHPVVLGGNIGIPIVERLPELTPGHRVVYELSELQLPTLSRGTTVAVYTNVTSDHLDRHGSLENYRRVKRRLAELVDPDGALVLNEEDEVVAAYRQHVAARTVPYRRGEPSPGGVGVDGEGWIVAAGVEPIALAGGGAAAPDRLAGSCRSTSSGSRASTTSPTRSRRSPWPSSSAWPRPPSGEQPPPSVGGAPPRGGRGHRPGPLRQRLPGNPAGRGDRRPALVPAASRPDRRRSRQGRGPARPRAGDPRARQARSS